MSRKPKPAQFGLYLLIDIKEIECNLANVIIMLKIGFDSGEQSQEECNFAGATNDARTSLRMGLKVPPANENLLIPH